MKYLTLRVTCLPGLRIYYNICVVLTGWRAVANLWWWSTASLSPSTFPYSITLPHPITLRHPITLPNPITLHYTTTRSPSTLSSSPSTQESQSSSPPRSPFSTPSPSFLSHVTMVPSFIVHPSMGITTFVINFYSPQVRSCKLKFTSLTAIIHIM